MVKKKNNKMTEGFGPIIGPGGKVPPKYRGLKNPKNYKVMPKTKASKVVKAMKKASFKKK